MVVVISTGTPVDPTYSLQACVYLPVSSACHIRKMFGCFYAILESLVCTGTSIDERANSMPLDYAKMPTCDSLKRRSLHALP